MCCVPRSSSHPEENKQAHTLKGEATEAQGPKKAPENAIDGVKTKRRREMRPRERQEREQPASRVSTRMCLFFLTFFSLKGASIVTEERHPVVQVPATMMDLSPQTMSRINPSFPKLSLCHSSELPALCITEIRLSRYNVKKPLPWSWAWTTIPAALRRPRQEDHQFEAILSYR